MGLLISLSVFITAPLLLSAPFSLAIGIELGLRGARFTALLLAAIVALAAGAALAILVFAVTPPSGLGRSLAMIERTSRLFVWIPELVIAAAFGLRAFLCRGAAPSSQAWLAGLAMAASAEALLYMKLVFQFLPSYGQVDPPAVARLLLTAIPGLAGVIVLTAPGWASGRALRWQAGTMTPRLAWTLWPCWLLVSTTLRIYGPTAVR